MECVDGGESAEPVYVYLARRNNSLSSSGRLLFFSFILAVCLGIALGFALVLGAWLILPFAGLEMAVLYWALRHIDRHAGDYERVVVRGSSIQVEVANGAEIKTCEFNRHWVQVICAPDGSRLALRSHGKEIEIGRHLRAENRSAMAQDLARHIRGAG
jgi:uncharacterized membrane protein